MLVRALHALGIGVSCWTVNDHDDIHRLLAMGVDAIMSDDLPMLRAAVDGRDWRAVGEGAWPLPAVDRLVAHA